MDSVKTMAEKVVAEQSMTEKITDQIYRIGVQLPGNPLRELNSYFEKNLYLDNLLKKHYDIMEKAVKKRSTYQTPTERIVHRLRGSSGKWVRKVASEPDSPTRQHDKPERKLVSRESRIVSVKGRKEDRNSENRVKARILVEQRWYRE